MHTKLIASNEMDKKLKLKQTCAQLWNGIVMNMYDEHLLSLEHLDKLLYKHSTDSSGNVQVERPKFFVAQEDMSTKTEFLPKESEAERRITFFAQSLSMVFPEPMSVKTMPVFSVLVPHYAEKIILSLREIIHCGSNDISLLEYLKNLHSLEWDNFVQETKLWLSEKDPGFEADKYEIPLGAVGFKDPSFESVLRTRLWASLRSQTLFRTVSGFMNYSKALELLSRIEMGQKYICSDALFDQVQQKFHLIVSIQRFQYFSAEEKQNLWVLLKFFPFLKIAFIQSCTISASDEEQVEGNSLDTSQSFTHHQQYYSCLIDGTCFNEETEEWDAIYKIRLPGYPILGDGKADNQNNSCIFARGEYLQLIDANQDHYFEEALKIRSIFPEFDLNAEGDPVAIVGGREYILSEKIGVLGDVAAGKEYTFGTISQRVTAKLGGRLHYGHPDFLNAVFMNTRGGLSKGQKGLHVNEDIYSGMNALQRGGKIKHFEFQQCGKGRDLGFSSILTFASKIGAGMGEQMISREHYRFGTHLPLDRLLTFYYAHPGFHVNNVFIMTSIHLFLLLMICLVGIRQTVEICPPLFFEMNLSELHLDCVDLESIYNWIKQAVFAIVIIFVLNFLPLFAQILTEKGLFSALKRIGHQISSLSPLFDVFTTQIYSSSMLSNLQFGNAAYRGTARAIATKRLSFHEIYESFASASIYFGLKLCLMLTCITAEYPFPHLSFFWIMVIPLFISPFLFNPHQFRIGDFMEDYALLIKWFSSGNSAHEQSTWISFHSTQRARITGHKRSAHLSQRGFSRAPLHTLILNRIFIPWIIAGVFLLAYGVGLESNELIVSMATFFIPLVISIVIAVVSIIFAFIAGPCFTFVGARVCFGGSLAAIGHGIVLLACIITFYLIGLMSGWAFSRTIIGVCSMMHVQIATLSTITTLLRREIYSHPGLSNSAFWNGTWCCFGKDGPAFCTVFFQPLREILCKAVELVAFCADFLSCHFILILIFPLCLVPWIDYVHTRALLWVNPNSSKIKQGAGSHSSNDIPYTKHQRTLRRQRILWGTILFATTACTLITALVLPFVYKFPVDSKLIPRFM